MLGGSCSPCCGKWYCCDPRPLQCGGIASLIDSVSVVITTGSDYILHEQASGWCFEQPGSVFAKAVSIVPVTFMSGTHQLSLQAGNNVADTRIWKKELVDGAGCGGPFVEVTIENNYAAQISALKHKVVLSYRKYQWQKISRVLPTESKSLADMQCESSWSGSSSGCFSDPLENYISLLSQEYRENLSLPCERDAGSTWPIGLSSPQIFTQVGPSNVNVGSFEKTFESGSLNITLQVIITGK